MSIRRFPPWLLCAGLLAACGGGGDGGAEAARVPVTYDPSLAQMFAQAEAAPTIAGADAPPVACSLASGSLPDGLALASDCTLRGRPLRPGAFTFVLDARFAVAGGGERQVLGRAEFAVPAPALVYYHSYVPYTRLALGVVVGAPAQVFNWPFTTVGGTWEYTVIAGALPPGLGLDAGNGLISGTTGAAGAYLATIQARWTTPYGSHTLAPSNFVANVGIPSFEYPVPVTAVQGLLKAPPYYYLPKDHTAVISEPFVARPVPVDAPAGATLGDFRLAGGSLPAGLSLDRATGTLAGVASGEESLSQWLDIEATVTTAAGAARALTRVLLSVRRPVWWLYDLGATAAVGTPVALVPRAMEMSTAPPGQRSVRFATRADACLLPPGLALDEATGTIAGVPRASGWFMCLIDETITSNGFTWVQPVMMRMRVR